MTISKNNILSLGESSDNMEELLVVTKALLCLNEEILEQAKLTNLYLQEVADIKLEKEDICQ